MPNLHRLRQPSAPLSPWTVAWLLLVPLALWLALAKTTLVMNALLPAPPDGTGLIALLKWFAAFTSLRFGLALLAAYAVQRRFFPARRWLTLPLAAAFMLALGLLLTWLKPGETLFQTLRTWSGTALDQAVGLAVCLWRDAVSVALLALAFGLLLQWSPARARPAVVRALQVAVLLLCALVGFDLVHELATGQPTSLRVLLFAASNLKDLAPLMASEATPFRLLATVGGVVLAAAWAWRQRGLARRPMRTVGQAYAPVAGALALSLGILLPAPSNGLVMLVRHTEGTLLALAKTTTPTLADEARVRARQAFEQTGRPPWHSAGMALKATEATQRRNVVIVMLESVRAVSTTLHSPQLPTMPFLRQLADQGLHIEDMNAVVPRTAAAWIAVLGGQYPLANEGTANWARANRRQPHIRSLPSVLREAGYATSFFTPTDLRFQSDVDVIHSFGFEHLQTEQDLTHPGAERVTYFGLADELMVQPVLDWSAAQARAGKPFLAALMTNVGHHTFETPASWKKIEFEGVSDPVLASYYNCLRYIDGVLASLVDGYRRLGLLEDTVFVLVGDHGQMFDEHNARQTYNAVYQEGLHVPAVIYAPGMALTPGTVRGPRQQIDILPTIVELLGYELEGARLPGQSLLKDVDPQRQLYFSSSIDWSFLAARQGPRKFIYSFERTPMEVFDLARDPQELQPLASVDVATLDTLKRDMLAWRVNAELSMMARPADSTRPDGPWVHP